MTTTAECVSAVAAAAGIAPPSPDDIDPARHGPLSPGDLGCPDQAGPENWPPSSAAVVLTTAGAWSSS
jgi:hypothetical protein